VDFPARTSLGNHPDVFGVLHDRQPHNTTRIAPIQQNTHLVSTDIRPRARDTALVTGMPSLRRLV
jgi:hypothetical protein